MAIHSDNIEATGVIRTAKVLQAREANSRRAYDVPEILDQSLDAMIDRAESEIRSAEAFEALADEEFQHQAESDR